MLAVAMFTLHVPIRALFHPGWCIIEWDGENTYDCINKEKISAVDGDLVFLPGEKVFAAYKGKPFKATIAVTAGTYNLRDIEFQSKYGKVFFCTCQAKVQFKRLITLKKLSFKHAS